MKLPMSDKIIINRQYYRLAKKLLRPGKVLFIVGPRRAGKTTFLNQFLKQFFNDKNIIKAQGDFSTDQKWLSSRNPTVLESILSKPKVLAIDEAHFIPNVGESLKIIVDHFPDLYILVTGSASLDIVYKIGEPLVGRQLTLTFLPFALQELYLGNFLNILDIKNKLEEILVYGLYPEVFLEPDMFVKQKLLEELINAYILKDILYFKKLKNPVILLNLLSLLAYQVGQLTSFHELSRELGISIPTVQEYIELLKQTFIIFEVPSFSTNKRNELKKSKKYYFYDNGIRNAVIKDFNDLSIRKDKGTLWENFLMSERYKFYALQGNKPNFYFWRTKYRQEVDLVEQSKNYILQGFEFKYNKTNIKKGTLKFLDLYPNAKGVKVINKDNFLEFVGIRPDVE